MNDHPPLLYKYRHWRVSYQKDAKTLGCIEYHRTKEMLTNAQFYCPPPRFFDDPHDALQSAKLTGGPRDANRIIDSNWEMIELMHNNGWVSPTQVSKEKLTNPKDFTLYQRAARKYKRRKTRVLSLSGDLKNELMWSFYADEHRGICLAFDATHSFFAKARKVCYINSPADLEEPTDDLHENDPLLYCKGRSWEWQNEWRVVWAGEEPRNITFPKEALKLVILGESFPHVLFSELAETLDKGGYTAKFMLMERCPDSFEYRLIQSGSPR